MLKAILHRVQALPRASGFHAAAAASVAEACRHVRDSPFTEEDTLTFGDILRCLLVENNFEGLTAFVRENGIELLIRATFRCRSSQAAGCCTSALSVLFSLYDANIVKQRIVACGGINILHTLVDTLAGLGSKDLRGVSHAVDLLINLKVTAELCWTDLFCLLLPA